MDFHDTKESIDLGKHGKDYEIEVSKFLLKRLIDGNFRDFKFTREKRGLGKFDDLVLIYEESKEKRNYSLVQLKHSRDESKTISYESLAEATSSPFYLPRYFEHYRDSCGNLKVDPDFKDAYLRDLIICTNVSIDSSLGTIAKVEFSNNNTLFSGSGRLFKLRMSPDTKRKIFATSYTSELKSLAKELATAIIYKRQIDMKSLIKDEHFSYVKKYHVPLALHVIDIRAKTFREDFLSSDLHLNSTKFLFREALVAAITEVHSLWECGDPEVVKEKLHLNKKKENCLKETFSRFQRNPPLQFLKGVRFNFRDGFGNGDLFPCSFKDLPETKSEFDTTDSQIDYFLDKLTLAVEQRENESILRRELTTDMFVAYNDRVNFWYHNGSFTHPSNAMRKREWITREKLISQAMNSVVNFQSIHIRLKQLHLDESLFDSEVLMKIFCNQSIVIGRDYRDINSDNSFYISRTLNRQRGIDKTFLKMRNADIVLLSDPKGMLNPNTAKELLSPEEKLYTMSNFGQNSRFIQLDHGFTASMFDEFVGKYADELEWENIHWLEIEESSLVWQKTFGSLSVLQEYFSKREDTVDVVREDELSEKNETVILVGEPGMGKSTLLHHVGKRINEFSSGTPRWVVKLAIQNIHNKLSDLEYVRDADGMKQFLFDVENAKNNFSKNVFHYCLLNNMVAVLIDGFDEIRSQNLQKLFLKFVKYLQNKLRIKKIFVATRPHCKKTLENTLGTVSFTIQEFTSQQQVQFLSHYWMFVTQKPKEHIHQFSEKLINSVCTHLKQYERNILGIPLQTYMFAVVFLNEVVKEAPLISDNLQLTTLFSQFLHSKYEIYFKKFGINFLPEDVKQLLVDLLDKVHENFAILHEQMFSQEDAEALILKQYLLPNIRLLDIGIIYEGNETVHFIHKTFSEYLTAKRLSTVILNKERDSGFCTKILKSLISRNESKFLVYLFDSELSESFPLHKIVLKGDDEDRVRLFSNEDITSKDCLQRTLAYYAVQYRHRNIMEILLRRDGFLEDDDPFLINALTAYLRDCYQSQTVMEEDKRFFITLLESSVALGLKIIEFFNIRVEMFRQNWVLIKHMLKICRNAERFVDYAEYLDNAFRFGAPLEIVEQILDSIRCQKLSFESNKLAYSFFMSYLLSHNVDEVDIFIKKYKLTFKSIDKEIALYIGMYEYFDLRSTFFGDSFSSLFESVKSRATRYTTVVKYLLENGASYIVLRNNHGVREVFEASTFNPRYVEQPLTEFINEKFNSYSYIFESSLEALRNDVQQYDNLDNVDTREDFDIKINIWEGLKDFLEEFVIDRNTTVKESIASVVWNILKSSKAKELLQLVFCFHEAVESNKYNRIINYLKHGEKYGWKKALLNSTDGNNKFPKQVAKRNLNFRIYFLLLQETRNLL